MPRAAALYAGAGAIAALLWLLAADLIWSGLSPNPFQIFGWWDALVLWGHDWLTTAYLAASAALPAAILILGVHLMFRLGGAPAWATAAGSAPLIRFQSNILAHARWGRLPEMIPLPRAVWIALAGGLYLATFTVLASLFLLEGTGLSAAFAHPYWQWWLYAYWYFSEDSVLRAWLVVSAVAAAVVPLVPVGIILYRHYRRIYGWTPWLAMVPRAAWLLAGTGLYFAVFTVLATVLFLIGTGLQGAFAHPFWQWWLYALWYSDDPVVHASGSNAAACRPRSCRSSPPGVSGIAAAGLVAGSCTEPAPRAPGGTADPLDNRQPWPCPLGADAGGAGSCGRGPTRPLAGSWSARPMIRGRIAGHSARAIRRHGARAGGRRC